MNSNPYKALSPYSEKDSNIYWGRDVEIANLYQSIQRNRSVILIGPSGCGKSSLLNAGIFPKLRSENIIPIRIVFNEIVSESLKDANASMTSEALWNRVMCYFRNVLERENIEITPSDSWSEEIVGKSLWNFLHLNKFTDEFGFGVSFVFVFDQFEQILSLFGNLKELNSFFDTFECLCGLRQTSLDSLLNSMPGLSRKEISSIISNDTSKFLLAIRQDYMFELNVVAQDYPVLSQNHLLITQLNEEQAYKIIVQPKDDNGNLLFSEKDAFRIIAYILNNADFELDGRPEMEVDTMMLSLVLYKLYEKYEESGMSMTEIIDNDIKGSGFRIIEEFYTDNVKGINDKLLIYLEENLVNKLKRRETLDINVIIFDLGSTDDIESGLNILQKRNVIRIFQQSYNERRVEFIHDRLCDVIHERKEERKLNEYVLEQERERTKRNLEYNKKKRATELNVLVHKGRRLIDNALDFGEFRTISDSLIHNTADNIINFAKVCSREFGDYLEEETCDFVNQRVFSDPLLKDYKCILYFYDKDKERLSTIDGLYGVELKYDGALISDIFFKGKKVFPDGRMSYDAPIFVVGGYSGIHIDYDEKHREVQRTYLDDLNQPITTQDGYSIVQTGYDEFDNPTKIRYYNFQKKKITPAKHIHGNYGYDSIYDKNGNEIERYFVDKYGQRTMIVSGVYGKRMVYDSKSFRLDSISNIDLNGKLMADKDGYVTNRKIYDDNGVPTLDLFLDEKGRPWETPDGTYGNIDIIDYFNRIIVQYNVDKDYSKRMITSSVVNINEQKSYIVKKDGCFKTIVKFNEKKQMTEVYAVDANDNIIETDDREAINLFEYDEQGRLLTLKVLDRKESPVYGRRFDYNKEGTHILHTINLNIQSVGKYESFDFEGIEYDYQDNDDFPVLQKFVNEFNQYKTYDGGYYAFRQWEDGMKRVVKQLYYDFNGTPMPNKSGVFGVKVEYLDEGTTKRIYLDADGNMMEDKNGVAFSIETENSSGLFQINYNMKGEPHADDGWVYIYQMRQMLDNGYLEKLYVQNSRAEKIQILRPRRANAEWELVPCMYEETRFDEKGRPMSQYFKDADGYLVGDSDGDSYTIWEYNDCNNTEILSLYNVNKELKLRMRTKRDEKNRVIEFSYLDKDNNLAELERGYSGEIHSYDEEEKKEVVTFIDSKGAVCNNKEGYAHRIIWYDQFGHIVGEKYITADGMMNGNIYFREYIDSERQVCAYYLYKKDAQGNYIPNNNGSIFDYSEDDDKGRTIKILYLNAEKIPMSDTDGDYGLSYEYDDEKRLTIITCLDENAQPHNNKSGYGIIHLYKDEQGRESKRMHFTVDGTPATFAELLGCYGLAYEYPNDPNEQNKIVGYLNENGEITTNKYGYAYQEECFNTETGVKRVFYYDKDRNNIQSSEGESKDYGYAIEEKNNLRIIYSLGKDGAIANNACGYAVRYELYEEGKLRFYKYYDADDKAFPDSIGDYGTEIQYSEDGAMIRYVSLNEKYKHHINDYGYCFCDVITDIAGDQIRICRDMEGNQVLPKLRFAKKVKNWLAKFKKKESKTIMFNCRQIGAIYDCVLGNIEGDGFGKKHGLHNTYVLLQYDNWSLGDEPEELWQLITNTAKQSKHLVLLPVTLNGSLLNEVGDIIEMDFPAGKIDVRFKEWGINIDTIRCIAEKKQEWDKSKS